MMYAFDNIMSTGTTPFQAPPRLSHLPATALSNLPGAANSLHQAQHSLHTNQEQAPSVTQGSSQQQLQQQQQASLIEYASAVIARQYIPVPPGSTFNAPGNSCQNTGEMYSSGGMNQPFTAPQPPQQTNMAPAIFQANYSRTITGIFPPVSNNMRTSDMFPPSITGPDSSDDRGSEQYMPDPTGYKNTPAYRGGYDGFLGSPLPPAAMFDNSYMMRNGFAGDDGIFGNNTKYNGK